MKRLFPCRAFTLIEMLVVMAVIAILTGLILSLNAVIQNTGARARATTEIKALSAAIEGYKADNGGYPQSSTATDTIDPTTALDPGSANSAAYIASSLFLWQQLSGHLSDTTPSTPPTGTNYAADFFKGNVMSVNTKGQMLYIQDPFGYSYGYSTAGLLAEQNYRKTLLQSGSGTRVAAGYNPTFDLWSTAGTTRQTTTDIHNKWIKNW